MSQRRTRNSDLPSTSQSQQTISDLNHLTGKVVRYFLEKGRKKYAIRTQDIKKYVLKTRSGDFKAVMKNAVTKLYKIFGYEVRQVTGGMWFLVNTIENTEIAPVTKKETAEQTLLFLTLSYIFMCSEDKEVPVVKEVELLEFFKNLTILNENRSNHSHFGNVQELIETKFVKQLYLLKKKDRETDVISYQWGPRADAEVKRQSILEFASKVYQNRPINTWIEQYRAMKIFERAAINPATDET